MFASWQLSLGILCHIHFSCIELSLYCLKMQHEELYVMCIIVQLLSALCMCVAMLVHTSNLSLSELF